MFNIKHHPQKKRRRNINVKQKGTVCNASIFITALEQKASNLKVLSQALRFWFFVLEQSFILLQPNWPQNRLHNRNQIFLNPVGVPYPLHRLVNHQSCSERPMKCWHHNETWSRHSKQSHNALKMTTGSGASRNIGQAFGDMAICGFHFWSLSILV